MRYLVGLCVFVAACGGGDRPGGECAVGGSGRFLPFSVGDSWTYDVHDVATPDVVTTKTQTLTMQMNHPDDGMPMIVQETVKVEGRTVGWLRQDADATVRLQQMDYTPEGVIERTTVYQPPRIRLDEAPARIADGASFESSYTEIEYDANDVEVARRDITEAWSVLHAATACPGDVSDLDCLHVSRQQIGLPPKEFWYSRGVGKVVEQGLQVEELKACSVD
jgi:hypothetical protein